MTFEIDFYEFPRPRTRRKRTGLPGGAQWKNQDFQCVHCRNQVVAQIATAGVQNRNHCPYCLWSKHMDLHQAGDRLAVCKCAMAPVGLSLKRTHKKYTGRMAGELMLVHQCVACGKISINRIAADDDSEILQEVFETSTTLGQDARAGFAAQGIQLLGAQEDWIVRVRLNGFVTDEAGQRLMA